MGSSDESMEIVREVLKDRFQHGLVKSIKTENKGKIENGMLALSAYRAFVILSTKSTKHALEHEFNYLEIKGMASEKDKQLKFVLENGKIINISTSSLEDTDCLIEYLTTSLLKVFPQTPISKLISSLKLEPNARETDLMDKLENLPPTDVGPCGGFSRMYACMCDHLKLTYMPEVAWDIDTIYLSQNCKNLCLNDFDHLNQRDLTPIIAALEYNSFFTQLSANSLKVKLVAEALKAIVHVLKKSAIEKLVLVDCNLKHEFAHGLNTALLANTKCCLTHLDLSQNPIEDRGLQAMSDRLAKLPDGLAVLKLAKTGITGKGASFMFKTFYESERMANVLQVLDVSHASFKEYDLTDLKNFLARPNALTHLDLSFTGLALDEIFNALVRGCLLKLSNLNLSGNTFTTKKAKPVTIPQSIKNFFTAAIELKVVGLAGNKLPPEVVKEIVLAISMNKNITDVELDLSSNELKAAGCLMLESVIACVGNIRSLDISDNDINDGLASFLDWVCENKTLRVLNVSKNLSRVKSLEKVMDAFVKLIQEEELPLENLSVADCHLNYETIVIINALGSNTSLTSIDFSGNNMRDLGAKMLAKALMINSKLEFVNCDRNNITADGYREIANALERNYTLKDFPMPVHDIHNSRQDSSKLEAPLHRIQRLLQRNHSSRKFIDDQAFRLQQGFLYTTAHQMVDKMVVQIQDKAMELESQDSDVVKLFVEDGEKYIKDADNSKKLLAMIHDVALKSSLETVELKLKSLASEVQETVQRKLKETLNSMLECAEDQCEAVMEKPEIKRELLLAAEERAVLPDRFMQDVLDQAAADISNKISEVHLAMAAQISDTVVGDILANLEDCYKNLSEHAENVPSLDKPKPFLDDEKFDATTAENEAPTSEPPVNPALARLKEEHPTRRATKRGIRPKSIIPQEEKLFDQPDMGVEPVTPPENVQPLPELNLPPAVAVPTPTPVTKIIKPLNASGFSGEVTTLVSLTKSRPKKPQRSRPTRPTVQPPNLPESEVTNDFTNLEGFYTPTVAEDKTEKKEDKKEKKDKKKKNDEPKATFSAKQEKKSMFDIFKRNKRDKSPSQGKSANKEKPQSKKKEDSKDKKTKAAEEKKKRKFSKDITPAAEEKPTPPPAEDKPPASPGITQPASPPVEDKPTSPVTEAKPEKKALKPPGGMGFGIAKTDLDKQLKKRKSSPLLIAGKVDEPDKPKKNEDDKPTVDQIQEEISEKPLNDIKSDLKAEIEKNDKEPSAVELIKNVEKVDDSDKKSEPTEEKEENTHVKGKEPNEEKTKAEEVANEEIKSVEVTNGKDSEPEENHEVPVTVKSKDEVKVVTEEVNNENKQENKYIVKEENIDTTDGNKKEITQPIEKLNEEENKLPQTELKTETKTHSSSKISSDELTGSSEGNTTEKETESTEGSTEIIESVKEKDEGKKEEKDEKNKEKQQHEKDEKMEEIHNTSEEINDKTVNVVNKDVTKVCTNKESTEMVPDVNGTTKENTDTTESKSAPEVETAEPVSPESNRPNLLSLNVDSASSENHEQKSPIRSPSRPTPSPRPTAASRPKSVGEARRPPVTKPRPTSMKPSPSIKPKPKKSNSTLQSVTESNVANAETNGTANGDVETRSEKSPTPSKPPVKARPKSIETSPSKNSPDVADKNFSPKKE